MSVVKRMMNLSNHTLTHLWDSLTHHIISIYKKVITKKMTRLLRELERQGIGVPMPIEEVTDERTPAPLALSLSSPYSEMSEEEKEEVRINVHIHKQRTRVEKIFQRK